MSRVGTEAQPALAKAKDQPGQVKETLISLIIAFIMAFVFRAFVVEAFIIPTGSMAPTLLGAHMRFQSKETGYNWPVNPPLATHPPPTGALRDPMTGEQLNAAARTRAGDRILVFKYLYSVYDPRRWDVVVFKAPHEPQTNYIKRLVALPGEQVAVIDGDVFVRPAGTAAPGDAANRNAWALEGWQIQRKPERVQRTVWQDVFRSDYEPLNPVHDLNTRATFRSPWRGGGPGWNIADRISYEYTGSGPTSLVWDNQVRRITDAYPYNELHNHLGIFQQFSVSDLNMSLGVEPATEPVTVAAVLRTRGFEFRGEIEGQTVRLRMGELASGGGPATSWRELGQAQLASPLQAGRVTNVEFWHVDQSLQLWVDGEMVAAAVYDWTPRERVRHALSLTLEEIAEQLARNAGSVHFHSSQYSQPAVLWEFSGGPLTLHRVGLQRDVFYQPASIGAAGPARATSPATSLVLAANHFFVLGDNSPMSQDARSWGNPEPWVAAQIDAGDGVVPRKLLIGRAFFVYFPALTRGTWTGIPVPDFGRMRWIW